MIDPARLQDLVGRWWWNYDEGNFGVLRLLLTDDAHFTCRTDTGTTSYEKFVRADHAGATAVMAWQTDHRTNSPYPLRHSGTNVHVTEQRGNEVAFSSYIFVTQISGGVAPLSSAIVHGIARDEGGTLRLAELHIVLDTMDSVLFADR